MVLDLPNRLQNDGHSCGAVAARVVLEYHGARVKLPPTTPIDGTSPDTLEATLWKAGLDLQSGCMDVEDLRYHTRRGRPVICLVTEPDGTGHYVVVSGVRRGRVHFHDPLTGPRSEKATAFADRWTDCTRRGVAFARWGIAASARLS